MTREQGCTERRWSITASAVIYPAFKAAGACLIVASKRMGDVNV